MRIALAMLALLVILAGSFAAQCLAAEYPEKWVYYGSDISNPERLQRTLDFFKTAKEVGCTHMVFNDSGLGSLDTMPPEYFENAKKVIAAADELGITLVPGIFNIGYSGRYLRRDANLAAGIPVKDAPYIVHERLATPDPASAPAILNAGFEETGGDHLTGWRSQDLPGAFSFVDTEVKHSGNSSLKVTNLASLPVDAAGACRASQTLAVRPFQYYRLSLWVRSAGLAAEGEDYVILASSDGKRRVCYTNLRVRADQDWTLHEITFNTFEATSIDFSVGVTDAKSGSIWFDDISIEPAGTYLVLRRDLTPLTVTSLDKSVTYVEGTDFEPVADPAIVQSGSRGYSVPHVADPIRLTPNSRIKDGETILVSFYHTTKIYQDQWVCSIQDPKILEILGDQMRRAAEAWPTKAYFMHYDEIRIGGWELQPEGQNLTPGQMLAEHVSTAIGYIKKYAPDSTIYTWSDMFDPNHNARPFSTRNAYYYLVNGNWDGAWEGLPSDVVVCNWNGTERCAESLKWFASRGNKQFLAGYYDGDMKENVRLWMTAADGVPNIMGMMYTTWRRNYDDMPEFFNLLAEWPEWNK